MRVPVLGLLLPPTSRRFEGSEWSEFDTGALVGIATVRDRRIDLLAVHARRPGRGDFRRFLADLMAAYNVVVVWAITNPFLPQVLERRGFRETMEYRDGELCDCMRWDRVPGSCAGARAP